MPSSWERLGLSPEEWRECQLAAIEMSVAAGARVPPEEVALEFVLARAFDETTIAQSALSMRAPASRVAGPRGPVGLPPRARR